jgi:ribosome modulation factor
MVMSIHCRYHKYYRQEEEGRNAGKNDDCPYGIHQIGKRCAWLAGFRDANRKHGVKHG